MSILIIKNFLVILFISIISYSAPTNTSANSEMLAMDGCSVSGWIIIINGNCQSNIVCDGESYWFDCCSDFGQDVGWCRT